MSLRVSCPFTFLHPRQGTWGFAEWANLGSHLLSPCLLVDTRGMGSPLLIPWGESRQQYLMVEEEGHHNLALFSFGSRMFTTWKPARVTTSLFSPITCTQQHPALEVPRAFCQQKAPQEQWSYKQQWHKKLGLV